MFDDKKICWFAIRVSYGRVMKLSAWLEEAGIEHFVPMARKTVVKDGREVTMTVPAVSNLCFVHSSKSVLDAFIASLGENRPVHYIWDKATRNPIVVADKAMSDFIQISRAMSDDVLYLKDITAKLKAGRKVRVLEGPFKGVEGVVLRVKRSRRVIVDFHGLLAVATTYVNPSDLELL